MKKILLVVMMITAFSLIAGSGIAAQRVVSTAGASYDASVVYSGDYKADALYFKSHPEDTAAAWRLLPRFDRLYKVTCQVALDSFNRIGTWQGHLDFKDGSCGSIGEPAEWATGNWRNYDKLRNGAGY